MEKQTKILLGVGAAIALYLILKPKKVIDTTQLGVPADSPIVDHPITPNPLVLTDKVKTDVEPITKDCVQVGYDCTNKTYNTIQIPLDADCNNYQPAMPQCAARPVDDYIMYGKPILANTI